VEKETENAMEFTKEEKAKIEQKIKEKSRRPVGDMPHGLYILFD